MPLVLEAMRYKGQDSETKTLWINETLGWTKLGDHTVFTVGAVTWFDDGSPWAEFNVEEVVYNADVQAYIRANGP